MIKVIDHIISSGDLTLEQFAGLMVSENGEGLQYLFGQARQIASQNGGNKLHLHAAIPLTSYCDADCLYCVLRNSNSQALRSRSTLDQALQACAQAATIGFRHLILQGGCDSYYSYDRLIEIITAIRQQYPDRSISLSFGPRDNASLKRLYQAGITGYLLRHKSADPIHFAKLHPQGVAFDDYQRTLADLREIGYQVGCGFMVGSPYQTLEVLYQELQLIRTLRPDIVCVSPFIPTVNTDFEDRPAGTIDATLRLLALIRILHPQVLLPVTSALSSLQEQAGKLGLLAGANAMFTTIRP